MTQSPSITGNRVLTTPHVLNVKTATQHIMQSQPDMPIWFIPLSDTLLSIKTGVLKQLLPLMYFCPFRHHKHVMSFKLARAV